MSFIKPLTELTRTDLPIAGGKGANLGALIQAGMPVPPGFVVTTAGYCAFVEANALGQVIQQVLKSTRFDDPAALDAAASQIRSAFEMGKTSLDLAAEISAAYTALGREMSGEGQPLAVAVRSSATAEDLPDLSFAGQQDTYLNIIGQQALLDAVVRCWGSLWTARAIGYRARNGINQDTVALAVVVQAMVQSEASGVLFTANPLTGRRGEIVIDATLGLGEALVSGQVEPDHYVVNDGQVTSKVLGAKALSIRGQAGGGTQTISQEAGSVQALPDEKIVALARLGRQAEQAFGGPQDLEWAFADGKLYVVQSRPITSLYPLPEGMPPEPLQVMVAFGAVQGLMDPITPYGRDGIAMLAAGVARFLDYPVTAENQRAFLVAGERIYSNITPLLRNRIGRNLVPKVLGVVEPGSQRFILELLTDPRLAPGHAPMRPQTAWRLLGKLVLPTVLRMVRTLLAPERARDNIFRWVEEFCQGVMTDGQGADSLAKRLDWINGIFIRLPRFMVERAIPTFAPGIAMWSALDGLAKDLPDGDRLVMEVTRGLPYNVTTEMDLVLWQTARSIRSDPLALAAVQQGAAAALAADFQAARLPAVAQAAVERFLARYGMRGVAEIDIGRRRWGEDPTQVFQALKSYLQIERPDMAPDAIFQRSAQAAEVAVEKLATAARRGLAGWFKERRIRWVARRVRALSGLRELPKFMVIRIMGLVRGKLLQSGAELAAAGVLEQAEDIFFLHLGELQHIALQHIAQGRTLIQPFSQIEHEGSARTLVAGRRAAHARELRRRQVPRLLLSDGRAVYEGVSVDSTTTDKNVLVGSPVSPGVVEGVVHVVLDPHQEQLVPGEILVCPGTDPAWTPLFLAAGGLVMEMGGLMTHGSVVAREYGIPAVVGVSHATTRLKNGQRIRVDGMKGEVVVLE